MCRPAEEAVGAPLEPRTMGASAYYGNLVRHRVAGPFALTESTFRGGSSLSQHYHERPYFTFTLSGSYRERYGTQSRRCTAGTAVAHPAFEMHSQEFASDLAILLRISIDGEEARDEAQAAFEAPACVNNRDIARGVSRVHRELALDDAFSDVVVEGLAYELVGQVLLEACPDAGSRRRALCARTLIRSSLRCKLPLGAIAKEMGVSRTTLYRDFKSTFGYGPGDYLRKARLDASRRMLRRSALPISEIAAECGFYDQSHFDRHFKLAIGVSPSQYRGAMR